MEIRLTASVQEPLIVKALDVTYGLPDLESLGLKERPPDSMPVQDLLVNNGIMVVKEYKF